MSVHVSITREETLLKISDENGEASIPMSGPVSLGPGPAYIPLGYGANGLKGEVLIREDGALYVSAPLIPGGMPASPVPQEPPLLPSAARRQELPQAIFARNMAVYGQNDRLDEFITRVLCLNTGPEWRTAASTALLGDWAAPLRSNGVLMPDAVIKALRAETQTIHRQLQPLWTRRTGGGIYEERRVEGKTVALLETPLGEGLTLRDVVTDSTCPEDAVLDLIPGDQILGRVLAALEPAERAVVVALGFAAVGSWREAAEFVGAEDPPVFAEQVRRKARRLAAEQRRRDVQQYAAPAPSLWQPEEGGESA
ncbi:hypothetical protein OG887_42210 (plasmid) [Streptomyces sp. NBC_00053]|uniref:hypothetical protein n=1 Tax=unclassified Streptomyces TaxID=2593676 RepID=UPI00225A48EF|nr:MULTISPECIES: hypothetical protein [unclassified Streptomyces]MCX5505846.1 hypothetical protein [Streptomyces sp. NBC_00052]MCX5553690.1 hypothetical protein [Streptomyces sp. NBC_00051]